MHHIFEPPNKEKKLRRRLRGCLHETGLTLVVLGLAFVLTARLNYGSIMAINSMESGWNIQFGLAGNPRLGWRELNLRPDSCKQPTGKTLHPN